MVEKKELFLIDSDSFMAPYRLYYAFDLVPTYWKELAEHAKTGRLVILDMVKNEIEKGEDALTTWIHENESNFVICKHVDAQIITKYQEILQYVQSCGYYNDRGINSWMQSNVADPWLIATAAAKEYTLITNEASGGTLSKKNQSSKVKIPDVAKEFGVKTKNIYYMMRQLGIKI